MTLVLELQSVSVNAARLKHSLHGSMVPTPEKMKRHRLAAEGSEMDLLEMPYECKCHLVDFDWK
jgi:hypothetical protein